MVIETAPSSAVSAAEQFESDNVRPTQGRALIVGSRIYADKPDRRLWHRDAIGVDMSEGPGVDRVLDLEDAPPADLGTFNHIECISVLEHSRRPWLLAANIERLLEPGGTLHVQAPFVWRVHAYPADLWRFTIDGVRALFPNIEWGQMAYAHERVEPKNKIPSLSRSGRVYFQRTEVCGFGVRK